MSSAELAQRMVKLKTHSDCKNALADLCLRFSIFSVTYFYMQLLSFYTLIFVNLLKSIIAPGAF